jgi:hypothetical protein
MPRDARESARAVHAGEAVDRYEVVAEIATGGMAVVYAVRRQHRSGFDKLLAMKMMLPHLAKEGQFAAMFLDEARIASHVQHPNVIQVFDVGEHAELPYIVMEFVRGQSLAAVLRQSAQYGRAIPRSVLYEILARAADGLHAAHTTKGRDGASLAIVHRDVSPHNVHVGYDGQVKVVDFGIAAARGKVTTTRTGEVKGKLNYLSPEQVTRPKDVDWRTDLWAFGVMAYECLTGGTRVFRGENDGDTLYNILHRPVPRLAEVIPDIEPEIDDLVARCLDRTVHRRPMDAAELSAALRSRADFAGKDPAMEIAGFMQSVFAVERAIEDERLASALPPETSEAPAAAHASGLVRVGSSAGTTRAPRWRVRAVLAAIAIAGVAGIGAAAYLAAQSSDREPQPAREEPSARRPIELPEPEPVEAHLAAPPVELRVDTPPSEPAAAPADQTEEQAPARRRRHAKREPAMEEPMTEVVDTPVPRMPDGILGSPYSTMGAPPARGSP